MRNIAGPRIREARYRAGKKVTQHELAARLQSAGVDIGRTAISKIEAGRRPVTDVEVVAICKALEVAPEWLLGWGEGLLGPRPEPGAQRPTT